jgi:DNA-binding PadR family transcriptional regulator
VQSEICFYPRFENGYVACRWRAAETSRRRKYYALKATGREALTD